VIGTQMIAKGWDFPDVTLIGILAADLSLHMSRHDAADRTFQLLDQVSGRAGRSQKSGYVVLQTYTPEHYAIQAVANHDSTWFYQNEKEVRKTLHFPPYGHLITIFASSRKEGRLDQGIEKARKLFLAHTGKRNIQIGQIIPCQISKADSLFRKEFMIQIPVGEMAAFRSTYFKVIESPLIGLRSEGCQISILWNEEA
jgi:primosomal protein N' (replication factor Y)